MCDDIPLNRCIDERDRQIVKMKIQDYRQQLPLLTKTFCRFPLTLQLHYDEQSDTILVQTQSPPHTQGDVDHLEFKIMFSPIFQEPQLLVRLWRSTTHDGISSLEPWYPRDVYSALNIPRSFQLGLDTISDTIDNEQGAWYSFHACDTAEIVGDRPDYTENYLQRWASVFFFSWFL